MSDWDKFLDKYKRSLKKMQSKEAMIAIGEYAASRIRLRTRLGMGVSKPNGNPQPLAALLDSTKTGRGKINLHPDTSPGFSNLTRTGQLLDSIGVIDVKEGEVTVGPHGNRSEGGSNRNVGIWQTKGDPKRNRKPRPFNNISKAENRAIRNFIAKIVSRFLKSGA